jgi:hypothetical protein
MKTAARKDMLQAAALLVVPQSAMSVPRNDEPSRMKPHAGVNILGYSL